MKGYITGILIGLPIVIAASLTTTGSFVPMMQFLLAHVWEILTVLGVTWVVYPTVAGLVYKHLLKVDLDLPPHCMAHIYWCEGPRSMKYKCKYCERTRGRTNTTHAILISILWPVAILWELPVFLFRITSRPSLAPGKEPKNG